MTRPYGERLVALTRTRGPLCVGLDPHPGVLDAWGLPRHQSQHPGGMVISTQPLIDLCPVQPASMEGRQMVQWDKDSCGDAGFLKIDLLGLGMLSAVERAVVEIERTRGERIDLSRIPFDDRKTYDSIQVADTMGEAADKVVALGK